MNFSNMLLHLHEWPCSPLSSALDLLKESSRLCMSESNLQIVCSACLSMHPSHLRLGPSEESAELMQNTLHDDNHDKGPYDRFESCRENVMFETGAKNERILVSISCLRGVSLKKGNSTRISGHIQCWMWLVVGCNLELGLRLKGIFTFWNRCQYFHYSNNVPLSQELAKVFHFGIVPQLLFWLGTEFHFVRMNIDGEPRWLVPSWFQDLLHFDVNTVFQTFKTQTRWRCWKRFGYFWR